MHIPLSIRLLALIALAWRLIIMAKKPNPLTLNSNMNFDSIEQTAAQHIHPEPYSRDEIKRLYREKIIGLEEINQENMLVYLYICIEKEYRKAGVYRFLWFKPAYATAFYQALKAVNYEEAQTLYAAILKAINPEKFNDFENKSSTVSSEDFIPHGHMETLTFETFDKVFDLDIFLQKIQTYVCKS